MYYSGFSGFRQNDGGPCFPEPVATTQKVTVDWDSCLEVHEGNRIQLKGYLRKEKNEDLISAPHEVCFEKAVLGGLNVYSISNTGNLIRWSVETEVLEYFDFERRQFSKIVQKSGTFSHIAKTVKFIVAVAVGDSGSEAFILPIRSEKTIEVIVLPGVRIQELACGKEHVVILAEDGTVFTYGSGSRGQLGHGSLNSSTDFKAVEVLGGLKMVHVAAGGWHTVALSTFGDAYIWGWNERGQLGLPCREIIGQSNFNETQCVSLQTEPVLLENDAIEEETQFIQAACGSRHTVLLTGRGEAYGFGWNAYGQLGIGGFESISVPRKVKLNQEFTPVGRSKLPASSDVKQQRKFDPLLLTASQNDAALPCLSLLESSRPHQEDPIREQWIVRGMEKNGKPAGEEELFWYGKSVVHSIGLTKELSHVKKILSVDETVRQSMWSTFYTYPDRPHIKTGACPTERLGDPVKGILILGTETLHVQLDSGTEYVVRLQFPVVKVWQTKFGILLERLKENSGLFGDHSETLQTDKVPRFYSLLHPLNEVAPVISVQGHSGYKKVNYLANEDKTLLFTSEKPSIAVVYDKDRGVHSIWKLRKVSEEEQVTVSHVLSTTGLSSVHPPDSKLQTPTARQLSMMSSHHMSPSHESGAAHTRSIHSMQHHIHSYHSESSPLNRTPLRIQRFKDSPLASRIESHSPVSEFSSLTQRNLTPSNSRLHSVRQGTGYFSPSRHVSNLSPQAQIARSPIGSWNDPAATNGMIFEEPILPDLCLQFVWEEPKNPDFITVPADKVFLSHDAVSQSYVCFLLSKQTVLCLLKYETLSTESNEMVFKPQKYIPAVDAEPLTDLNMILVLDPLSQGENSLSLYSGAIKISRIVPPTIPTPQDMMLLSMSIPYEAIPSLEESGRKVPGVASLEDSDVSMSFEAPAVRGLQSLSIAPGREKMLLSTPGLSSSRRNSLAFVGRHPSQLDESMNLLSPVGSCTPVSRSLVDNTFASPLTANRIVSLRDGVRNRATIRYTSGEMSRLVIPPVSTHPLVQKCLSALYSVVLKSDWDNLLHILAKWYTKRNAPGSKDLNPCDEWTQFSKLLLASVGVTFDLGSTCEGSNSPDVETKRTRLSEGPTEFDWEYLKSSSFARTTGRALLARAGVRLESILDVPKEKEKRVPIVDKSAVLSRHVEEVFWALHLLYEEMKLSMIQWPHLPQLVETLATIASALGLVRYSEHYWMDFPRVSTMQGVNQRDFELKKIPREPASVLSILKGTISGENMESVSIPVLKGVNERSLQIFTAYALMFGRENVLRELSVQPATQNSMQSALLYLNSCGWGKEQILDLPFGVSIPFLNVLTYCHHKPQPDWPKEVYDLVSREDLARVRSFQADHRLTERSLRRIEKLFADTLNPSKTNTQKGIKTSLVKSGENGMEGLDNSSFRQRFPNDRRLDAVRRFLCSSRPVTVALTQRPEVSDHDFLEEQERHLFALCMRTMALPLGRGALMLQTSELEEVFDPLFIPRLCLSGKAPPRNTAVELTHIDVPSNMNQWPSFHNGVAAGLTLRQSTEGITDTWIGFNRPKATSDSFGEPTPEHAGFLFALGLLGHLPNITKTNLHAYMVRHNDMLFVAATLGMGISKKGTMASSVLRMLAVGIEALTPSTVVELNVPPSMTVSAFISLGWLYLGSGDWSMSEILLDEIGRPPGPESDSCVERESHALSAGLGLGLVCLGKGESMNSINDRGLADTLRYYMIGGRKRPLADRLAEKYRGASFQIYEGDLVNTDITAPGSTLALGLMYLKSGNRTIADWMDIPTKVRALEGVRPDMLLLRVLAKNLILWDDIVPSLEWIENHVPEEFRSMCLKKPTSSMPADIDYETLNQAYCNIIPGACFALGIRFAGSANAAAFDALIRITKRFVALSGKSIAELAGRATIETALNVMLLSLAMVMSGTGDLEVLRLCRHLRSRVGFHGGASSSSVTYGSHMAIHLALGLLFLGGGRMSLCTTNEAVAALVCALYPKFPNHSNDNRYHLQALRHLYVLAAEPRLIVPRDLDTTQDCYVHMRVTLRNTGHFRGASYLIRTPCLLPELNTIEKVVIEDENYWTIEFHRRKNWDNLTKVIQQGYLYVKRKVGGAASSPGKLSLLFGSPASSMWGVTPKMVEALTNHPVAASFCKYFLQEGPGNYFVKKELSVEEQERIHMYSLVTYECVNKEKLDLLPALLTLAKLAFDVKNARPSLSDRLPLVMSQLSLVSAFANSEANNSGFLPPTLVDAMTGIVGSRFASEENKLKKAVKHLLAGGKNASDCELFPSFLSLHDLRFSDLKGCQDLVQLAAFLQEMKKPYHVILLLLSCLS